jgi:hypothetical protein
MVKISFGMIVFNGDYVLRQNLESIYPFAHEIVIAEGPVQHYQNLGFSCSTDNTVDIIKSFPDPEGKIKLIQGRWQEKDAMCQAYLAQMTGDYVWHVDSDEFYRTGDMAWLINHLERNKDSCYSMSFKLYSFFGGFERHISGFEETFEVHRIQKIIPGQSRWVTHRPPTMIWPPTGKTCRQMGHTDHNTTDSWGIRLFHYSFVFPAQVKAKTEYYYRRDPRGIIPNYWNGLFVPWLHAATEAEKLRIEQPTLGVQVWLPPRRGPAFTKAFAGEHPDIIKRDMPLLLQRIEDEKRHFGI